MAEHSYEQADLAAGCFWGVEAAYMDLPGVVKTEVGYEGGKEANPTYEQVSAHLTAHVETLRVTYDPKLISYRKLLEVFFKLHNPTHQTLDNYRSVIFYHTKQQKQAAESAIKRQQAKYGSPILTELRPAQEFWLAEEYHQQFFAKQGH